MSSSFYNSGIFAPDAGDAMDGGGSLPYGSGIVDPPSRRNKIREALMAANKYKSETDYKAEKESKEKEKRAAQRNTMKIDDNISVMEGYTDPGFRVEGVKGRSLLGTVGAVVTPFAPLTGQAIGAVGNLTGY